MHGPSRTIQELIEENALLKKRIQELENSEGERKGQLEKPDILRSRLSKAEIISRMGNWEFDLETNRVFSSDGARNVYGIQDLDWTIPDIQKIPLPEYRNYLDQAFRDLINENRPYDVEFKIRRPDNGEIVDIHSVAEYDSNRNVVFGIIQDITDRKRAEEELKRSEEKYRELIDSANSIILKMDNSGNVIFFNKFAQHFFGYSEDEIIGKNVVGTIVPELESTGRNLKLMIQDIGLNPHKYVSNLNENIRFNGERVWIAWTNKPVFDENGLVTEILCIGNDITDRKRAEEEVLESRRNLADIIDFLPDATVVIDKEGKVIFWNKAMEALTGIKAEAMLGKGDYEYSLPFYGKRRPVLIDLALHPDLQLEKEYSGVRRVGEILFGEAFTPGIPPGDVNITAAASVLRNSRREVIAAIECVRDNTERKKLEERLKRAEKMEGLGRLAGGVAHDLNNVLGITVGYSELLADRLPENNPLRRYADNILHSTVKAAAIIQDLLTIARRGVTVSEVVDLNRIVVGYLKAPEFERLKEDHPAIFIRTDLADGLLNIKGSPIHLSKTLMNLIHNAMEAISGHGEVTIKTENRYLDIPIRGYDSIQEGDYVVLTVSDTGQGISINDLDKIFEPFYTKKVMGRSGTGLGLAVVWGTVKDHNGYIDVQSEEGKGSTFTLYFPVTREKRQKIRETINPSAYTGKGESILIVDDVEEQRELAKNILKMLGYRAETVASGEEAIEFLKSRKPDLVVLDMIMEPGMDGLETYRNILQINPRQKAIIVSGFSETDRVRETQELGAGEFVRKPYILEQIGLAVRHELDRK